MKPYCLISILVIGISHNTSMGQNAAKVTPDRSRRVNLISQTVADEIPLVIAHRGASGYLPEHTTESAAFAHALGADYIEQDVVLSKDGVPVVLHDITLDAVTNVAELFPDRKRKGRYYVFDFDLDELRKLNVHERLKDRNRFPSGTGQFRISTLEEHIQLIQGMNASRNRNAGVYVEVKSPDQHRKQGLDLSAATLKVLAKYGYKEADDRAFVQCFDSKETLRLRSELNCRLPLIQLLSNTPDAEEITKIAKVADGIGVKISAILNKQDGKSELIFSDVVRIAHEHALMVHVWTFQSDNLPDFVESPSQLLDLLVRRGGIDGVFTDQPDPVLSWRTSASQFIKQRGTFHLLNN